MQAPCYVQGCQAMLGGVTSGRVRVLRVMWVGVRQEALSSTSDGMVDAW